MEATTWQEDFYNETRFDERQEIYEAALEREGDTREMQIIKQLWEIRYGKRKGRNSAADHFIAGLMELNFYAHQKFIDPKPRALKKTVKQLEDDFGLLVLEQGDEEMREAFYKEYANMVKLYLRICESDRTYNSVLLGMGHMKKESFLKKLSKDIYDIAYKVPQGLQLEERLALFTKAATDAFFEVYPKGTGKKCFKARIEGKPVDDN